MAAATQPLPESSVTSLAPGTAFAASGIADVVMFMAPAGAGPINTPKSYNAGDVTSLLADFQNGAGVKEAARAMSLVSVPFGFMRLTTAAVAASFTAITATLNVSSTIGGHAALSGAALDGADVLITFTVGCTTGITGGMYTVTLGGVVGAPVALSTGLTITVLGVVLTFVTAKIITAGDTFEWLQLPGSSTVLPVVFTGTGTSAITVTGTTLDAYEVAFETQGPGTVTIGTALPGFQVRYALDAGASNPSPQWSAWANLGIANTLALLDGPNSSAPTGLTLNFGAGTLVPGDGVTFATTQPTYDAAGASEGIAALKKWKGGSWTWMRFVGPISKAVASSIEPVVAGLDAAGLPTWAVVDARDRATYETLAAWETGINGVQQEWIPYTSTHVPVSAGMARMNDGGINGRLNRRTAMCALMPRALAFPIQKNWGEYDDGPLPTDVTIADGSDNAVEHDANTQSALNAIGLLTLRTWPGDEGVFNTNACLPAPVGEIGFISLRRALNIVMRTQNRGQRLSVLKNFTVVLPGAKPQTLAGYSPLMPGDLDAASIQRINRVILTLIKAAVVSTGIVQAVDYKVNQTPQSLGGDAYRLRGDATINGFIYPVLFDGTAQFVTAAS